MKKFLDEPLSDDFQEDKDFHEDAEYEEEGWEWGPLFGFKLESFVPLADDPDNEDLAPLADVGQGPVAADDLPVVKSEPVGAGGGQQAQHAADDGAHGGGDGAAVQEVSKADKWFSPKYWEPPAALGVTRAPHLDPIQSDWIMGQLAKWQDEHAGGDRKKKPEGKGSNDFYKDMRCDSAWWH